MQHKSNIDFPMIELKKWNQSSMSIYLLISRFTEPIQCSPARSPHLFRSLGAEAGGVYVALFVR